MSGDLHYGAATTTDVSRGGTPGAACPALTEEQASARPEPDAVAVRSPATASTVERIGSSARGRTRRRVRLVDPSSRVIASYSIGWSMVGPWTMPASSTV